MRQLLLFFWIYTLFINISYALPLWILVLGYDFFILFFWFVLSWIVAIFFYFKNLNLKIKFLIILFIILTFFPLKFFYIEYKKENYLKEYLNNIKNLKINNDIINNKNENNDIFFKKAKTINKEGINNNVEKYYIINILEKWSFEPYVKLENFKNYDIHNIRPSELFKNIDKIILENTNKKIVLTCITWYRSKLISWFLNWKWYNVYYIDWWMSNLWIIKFQKDKKSFKYCKNENKKDNIFINIWDSNSGDSLLFIPYLKITDREFKEIILDFEKKGIISKNDSIVLSCDKSNMKNCSVWRVWANSIMKDLWFKDICLSSGIIF